MATWLHEKGFFYEKRNFKLFTFSRLLSKDYFVDKKYKQIHFYHKITLKISAVHTDILESLAIHLIKSENIELNNQFCNLLSVEVEKPIRPTSPVKIKTLSPITTYSTLVDSMGKKKTYFYNPFETDFSKKIMENLQRKIMAYLGKENPPPLDGAYLKPLRVDTKSLSIINFKGFWIKAWNGVYELNLPEPYFHLAYYAGLGSRNSQGFGMIEIMRENKYNKA
ncbi:MAG: CRISPR-associated endoribonuclease Cas6 [Desulfonauticus sp.]|nr:CRISPR-associated endoribonuclease Cas6 [Desulfonauticus sp.]